MQCFSLSNNYLKKRNFTLTFLLSDVNCYHVFFGISANVLYIFISVSFFHGEFRACFTKYSAQTHKINGLEIPSPLFSVQAREE